MVIKKVRVRAPAKINLSLEVIVRRGDGFHEIDTVMTTVSLFDNISIESSEKLSINFTGPYSQGIDPANDLAGRAAIELAKITGREPNVAITIEKQIPSSAGLGGGSSDAAAVLRGLNKFWDLNQELKDLEKIASKIGRTYSPRHGLKEVVMETVGIELDKQAQSSDWGKAGDLTQKQLIYAANDVRYLLGAKHKLEEMLKREERWELAQKCFQCVPIFSELDRRRFTNIFDH